MEEGSRADRHEIEAAIAAEATGCARRAPERRRAVAQDQIRDGIEDAAAGA